MHRRPHVGVNLHAPQSHVIHVIEHCLMSCRQMPDIEGGIKEVGNSIRIAIAVRITDQTKSWGRQETPVQTGTVFRETTATDKLQGDCNKAVKRPPLSWEEVSPTPVPCSLYKLRMMAACKPPVAVDQAHRTKAQRWNVHLRINHSILQFHGTLENTNGDAILVQVSRDTRGS